jgi:hypothetical protein
MVELKCAGLAFAAVASLAMLAISIAPSAALTLPSPASERAVAIIQIENADYQIQGDRQEYHHDRYRHRHDRQCWRNSYGRIHCVYEH